jgi:hypothetical protein
MAMLDRNCFVAARLAGTRPAAAIATWDGYPANAPGGSNPEGHPFNPIEIAFCSAVAVAETATVGPNRDA